MGPGAKVSRDVGNLGSAGKCGAFKTKQSSNTVLRPRYWGGRVSYELLVSFRVNCRFADWTGLYKTVMRSKQHDTVVTVGFISQLNSGEAYEGLHTSSVSGTDF